MLWPQRLSFGSANYRQYDLQDFGGLIKTNAIPLCVIEPHNTIFANNQNQDAAKRNLAAFSVVHQFLFERKVVSMKRWSWKEEEPKLRSLSRL